MAEITPVILSGGTGTRLWPLSRQSYPKQLLPLAGSKPLLRAAADLSLGHRLTGCREELECGRRHPAGLVDGVDAQIHPGVAGRAMAGEPASARDGRREGEREAPLRPIRGASSELPSRRSRGSAVWSPGPTAAHRRARTPRAPGGRRTRRGWRRPDRWMWTSPGQTRRFSPPAGVGRRQWRSGRTPRIWRCGFLVVTVCSRERRAFRECLRSCGRERSL